MKRRDAGFSFVEVLVAVALMGIALAGITMTGVVSMRADTKSHLGSAATSLAQARLDDLRTTQRNDTAWQEGTHTQTGVNEQGQSGTGGPFTRAWVVDLDYQNKAELARVTVTVSWNEGGPQSVTLSSLYW